MSIKKHVTVFFYLLVLGCGDNPEEYPGKDQIRCEEFEGVCTSAPSNICQQGMQPLTANDPVYTDCFGQCCIVPDNPSSCDETESFNCVPIQDGIGCRGNWRAADGTISCREGRACCFWGM